MDKPAKEPAFTHPPQWIHESVAARCFAAIAPLATRREARRRAILALLERIPGKPKPPSSPRTAATPRSRS